MQFIPLPKPELLIMQGTDLFVRQSFHSPSIELVKHLELLGIVIIFVKELGCLDAPFEH